MNGLLLKNLSSKNIDVRLGIFPDVNRKTRFAGSVFQELLAVPVIFARHLRQQQASTVPPLNDQTVRTDFDLFDPRDFAERRENRNLDDNGIQLIFRYSREPWILKRGLYRNVSYRFCQRCMRLGVSNAATELAVLMEGHERAAGLQQDARDFIALGKSPAPHCGIDRGSSNAEEGSFVFIGQLHRLQARELKYASRVSHFAVQVEWHEGSLISRRTVSLNPLRTEARVNLQKNPLRFNTRLDSLLRKSSIRSRVSRGMSAAMRKENRFVQQTREKVQNGQLRSKVVQAGLP